MSYDSAMDIDGAVAIAWRELRADLERFIARRVSDKSQVDDLLQETFIKVSQHCHDLKDSERMAAWVYRIARNTIVDHHRRAARAPNLNDGVAIEAAGTDEPERENLNEHVAGWIRPFLATLPDHYRQALELTELGDLGDLTQSELAAQLGLSVSGAKTRVQRARHQLRDAIERCCTLELDARGNVLDYVQRPSESRPRRR
jgi:RNA polymerase sigma-70 factor, ECF subfamily